MVRSVRENGGTGERGKKRKVGWSGEAVKDQLNRSSVGSSVPPFSHSASTANQGNRDDLVAFLDAAQELQPADNLAYDRVVAV